MRPARQRRTPPRTARQRWLLIATAVGSSLVMSLSGLQALFGQLHGSTGPESASILGKPPPQSKTGVPTMLVLGSQTRYGHGR